MTTVLGINHAFHDSAACLVRDGRLLVAIEEERLTRDKHTQAFPAKAIARCLLESGIAPEAIDHVAVSIDPGAHQADKLAYAASLGEARGRFLDYEFARLQERHVQLWDWHRSLFGTGPDAPPVHFVDHHRAHAIGSWLVSGYERAAILSIDGWGEWSTTWLGEGDGGTVREIGSSVYPNSLGLFYSAVTEWLGFEPNYDEGKTMGLAPFGDAERFYDVVRGLVSVDADGTVTIDRDAFDLEGVSRGLVGERLVRLLGAPRAAGEPIREHHQDVAAAFQRVLEECVLSLAGILRERSDATHLVIAGGVALNSVANGRVLREAGFEDIYVMPAAGDAGTCIGAACTLSHDLGLGEPTVHDDPYLGTAYSDGAIRAALEATKTPYRRVEDRAAACAELLARGQIVGWFQGRMEFGPRSLGNRSILADPRSPDMKAKINAEVKHREPFRPFAPMVTRERCGEFFDLAVESPFMLKVCDVREDARDRLPAVTHVDGTARVQTVRAETNPLLHALLERFGEVSDVPVILNTSFNVMGEPIVESPSDALRCFWGGGLDALVIGPYVVEKAPVAVALESAAPRQARAA